MNPRPGAGTLLLACCAVLLPAQDPAGKGPRPSACDVHFFTISGPVPGGLPRVEDGGVRRIAFDAGGAASETDVAGAIPGIKEFKLKLSARGFDLAYSFGARRWTMGGTDHLPIEGAAVDTMPWIHGGRLDHRHPRRYALVLPLHGTSPGPPALFGREELVDALIDVVLAEDGPPHDGTVQALASLPLEAWGDPRKLEQLVRRLEDSGSERSFGSRLREAGERLIAPHVRSGPHMGGGGSDALYARFLAGDHGLLRSIADQGGTPEVRRVLAIAFAQAEDPAFKGSVGWSAVEPRMREYRCLPELVHPLAEAVRSGAAVLPGDAAERSAREAEVDALDAETRPGPALLALAAGALVLVLVVLAARLLGRTAIS